VLAGPKASALLEKSPHMVYDKKAGWREKGRLLRELRKDRYD